MSNENKSIHEFDIQLICEYFSTLHRQGPGSREITIKAAECIDNLNRNSRIADLGCGTGGQTITLAEHLTGTITGIDIFPDFINRFNKNIKDHNLQERVNGLIESMDQLPFKENELDLIWCEGAIYNIGFVKGISYWKKFLKQNGYMAITEASWFTNDRPQEIENFWMDAYPEIDTIPNKISQLQQAGFVPVSTFILPESCWTDNFYQPQIASQIAFLQKYRGNKTVEELISSQQYEAKLYEKYSKYYGYVFYIAKKL